jgi:hypothetical protein
LNLEKERKSKFHPLKTQNKADECRQNQRDDGDGKFIKQQPGVEQMIKRGTVIAGGIICLLATGGCAAKLPEHSYIKDGYDIKGHRSFVTQVDCADAQVANLAPGFAGSYCDVLASNIKLQLVSSTGHWQAAEAAPLEIKTKLETLNGGNAATRFWISYGAGRALTGIYVEVFEDGQLIAAKRFSETSWVADLAAWSNEALISRDAPLVAKKVADFVLDPHPVQQIAQPVGGF